MNFGTSLTNIPTVTNLGTLGVIYDMLSIKIKKYNNQWILFITNTANASFGANTIIRLNFGNLITNSSPTTHVFGSFNTNWPHGVLFFEDCGQEKAFYMDGLGNRLLEFTFLNGIDKDQISVFDYGNVANFNQSGQFTDFFIGPNGNKTVLLTNGYNNSILRLEFSKCNDAGIPRSFLPNPAPIHFDTAGIYTVSLTINKGMANEDEECKTILIIDTIKKPDARVNAVCEGGTINLSVFNQVADVVYSWSGPNGFTANIPSASIPNATASNTGSYIVTATGSCNTLKDTVFVEDNSVNKPNLGDDKIECKGDTVELSIPLGDYEILWNNGSTQNNIYVFEDGIYSVTVGNFCGYETDSIKISFTECKNCNIKVPTAFSPNGDNENDTFKPLTKCSITYNLIIANRWGEIVYQGDNAWDGNFKGAPAAADSYGWFLQYIDPSSLKTTKMQGNFILLR